MTRKHTAEAASPPVAGPASARREKTGRLKVFLGMAPGVGKTAAMLQAALVEKAAGRSVVIGTLQTHGVDALEKLAGRLAHIGHSPRDEVSPEEIIARRPGVVLIDQLAHANPREARHPKRFQDVEELIEAGIDVYTTLNVYEIASRADILWSVAGTTSHQTIPDGMLDKATVVLVDLPPSELLLRVKQGEVHFPANFFTGNGLLTLREMTARFFAERVAADAQKQREASNVGNAFKAAHRVLVATDGRSDAEPLILRTRRMAGSLNAPWIVLYVETTRGLSLAEESRLKRNLELARELGAEVTTTVDDNFAEAVLRVAASRQITQIVVGKGRPAPWWLPVRGANTTARLIQGSGQMAVHVAPIEFEKRSKLPRQNRAGINWLQYLITTAVVGIVTWIGILTSPQVGTHATALLSLFAIVLIARFVERGPALFAAGLFALAWDFFFLPPVFDFRIDRPEDAMVLGMYFVVALALGQLTAKATKERQRESRATALYLLGRELAEATTVDQIVRKVVPELRRSFNSEVAVLLPNERHELQLQEGGALPLEKASLAVASWVMDNRQPAGKFTANFPTDDTLFVPLENSHVMLGVLGLRFTRSAAPTIHQRNLLDALAHQIALTLDRQRLSELSEKAKVLAESERLGKTLLDSIPHELRTPIAAIKTAATDLAEYKTAGAPFSGLIDEIQEAAERLNGLVGKVLDITRLESGHIKPLFNECEVNDIVNVAVAETEKNFARHKLTVELAPNLPIIRTDFVFLQQALMNLLSNAALHTPAGTPVRLRVWNTPESLFFVVADAGPGIEPESIGRIFDKFYRAPDAPTGGLGLGLPLVKGFIEAIGGKIEARNQAGGGAEFTITLPLAEAVRREPVSI